MARQSFSPVLPLPSSPRASATLTMTLNLQSRPSRLPRNSLHRSSTPEGMVGALQGVAPQDGTASSSPRAGAGPPQEAPSVALCHNAPERPPGAEAGGGRARAPRTARQTTSARWANARQPPNHPGADRGLHTTLCAGRDACYSSRFICHELQFFFCWACEATPAASRCCKSRGGGGGWGWVL